MRKGSRLVGAAVAAPALGSRYGPAVAKRRIEHPYRLAAGSALVMLLLVWGAVWLERTLLYPRGVVAADPGALSTPGLERWWLDSPEGRVEAWFLPAEGTGDAPAPTVLFAHGNGELIDHWPRALAPYRRLGLNVILAEYRGYGRSAGAPTEDAITEDLERLHARVLEEPRVDADRLVFHGRSLGGGAIGTLIAPHPPRALILESTFTSVPDVISWLPRVLFADRFETLERLPDYAGPTLVFHGVRDGVIDVSHGRRLAGAARAGQLVTYDCGHNDLPPPGADYWGRIERHLRDAEVLRDP